MHQSIARCELGKVSEFTHNLVIISWALPLLPWVNSFIHANQVQSNFEVISKKKREEGWTAQHPGRLGYLVLFRNENDCYKAFSHIF